MEEIIHVIGHKNPDTDSICSAIGYAHLRNALGDMEVRPARAGELNRETRYVLQRFSLPVPDLLTDAAVHRIRHFLEGCMSRKKQIVPMLETAFAKPSA